MLIVQWYWVRVELGLCMLRLWTWYAISMYWVLISHSSVGQARCWRKGKGSQEIRNGIHWWIAQSKDEASVSESWWKQSLVLYSSSIRKPAWRACPFVHRAHNTLGKTCGEYFPTPKKLPLTRHFLAWRKGRFRLCWPSQLSCLRSNGN